jgi:hypothetical protein
VVANAPPGLLVTVVLPVGPDTVMDFPPTKYEPYTVMEDPGAKLV